MWEILFVFIVLIFVMALAYFTTKKIANIGALRMQGKNMKVIESLQVGISQTLHLVKVGDMVLLIGSSKDGITYLCEIDDQSIKLPSPEEIPSFEDYFKKMISKNSFKKK